MFYSFILFQRVFKTYNLSQCEKNDVTIYFYDQRLAMSNVGCVIFSLSPPDDKTTAIITF